jgi:hypothetical protein
MKFEIIIMWSHGGPLLPSVTTVRLDSLQHAKQSALTNEWYRDSKVCSEIQVNRISQLVLLDRNILFTALLELHNMSIVTALPKKRGKYPASEGTT